MAKTSKICLIDLFLKMLTVSFSFYLQIEIPKILTLVISWFYAITLNVFYNV